MTINKTSSTYSTRTIMANKKRAEFDLSTMLQMQGQSRLTPTPMRPFYDVNWHLTECNDTMIDCANTNMPTE
jgi:hypothetical protein